MAAVKTERTLAGQKTPPKRPKDWVAPPKVITCRVPGGQAPVGVLKMGASWDRRQPQNDEEQAAVTAYDAACKALAQCKPGDSGAENKRAVAYQRLVQLGMRPQVRGRRR